MRVRFCVLFLILSVVTPPLIAGQAQLVSPSDLRQAVVAAAQARQKNLDDVRSFFSSESVRATLKTGKVDYKKVDHAIATLSPEELARLAARTNQIQKDFAAGALSNQELTYIVIALATAVIILIIIEA
jgi:hypothetical protein